jgi:hypothetical protein
MTWDLEVLVRAWIVATVAGTVWQLYQIVRRLVVRPKPLEPTAQRCFEAEEREYCLPPARADDPEAWRGPFYRPWNVALCQRCFTPGTDGEGLRCHSIAQVREAGWRVVDGRWLCVSCLQAARGVEWDG